MDTHVYNLTGPRKYDLQKQLSNSPEKIPALIEALDLHNRVAGLLPCQPDPGMTLFQVLMRRCLSSQKLLKSLRDHELTHLIQLDGVEAALSEELSMNQMDRSMSLALSRAIGPDWVKVARDFNLETVVRNQLPNPSSVNDICRALMKAMNDGGVTVEQLKSALITLQMDHIADSL